MKKFEGVTKGGYNRAILLKMGQPRPFLSFILGLLKQTSLQFLQQIFGKIVQPV